MSINELRRQAAYFRKVSGTLFLHATDDEEEDAARVYAEKARLFEEEADAREARLMTLRLVA